MLTQTIEEQIFLEAYDNWNLELLFQNLANIKQIDISRQAKLSPVEKAMLRGLLAGYSPKEIANSLHWTSASVSVALSKGVYRYVEILTNRDSNSLKSWHDIAKWLEEAGYKDKSKPHQLSIGIEKLPEDEQFYGREKELTQLKQWIVDKGDRLIVLSGMLGIGKTALAVRLVRQIQSSFEYIIWQDLKYQPCLSKVLVEILNCFSIEEKNNDTTIDINTQINHLLKFLQQQKCLLILDGLENVMAVGKIAGFYQNENKEYSQLLERISSENHQSCLLVISQDEPVDMPLLQREKIDLLRVIGLGKEAKQIFVDFDLLSSQYQDKLISQHCGNPLLLKLVSEIIKNLFDGNIYHFLAANQSQKSNFIPRYFSERLKQQLKRLSKLEIEILYLLANNHKPICFDYLQEKFYPTNNISHVIQAVSSLRRRSFISITTSKQKTYIRINNIIKNYFIQEKYNQHFLVTKKEYNK